MRFDAIGNAGSNCGGEGSCGTCLVAVTRGLELISQPGRIEGKALAKQNRPARWRWSCRAVLGANNQVRPLLLGPCPTLQRRHHLRPQPTTTTAPSTARLALAGRGDRHPNEASDRVR
jgi:hypothetical protein